MRVLAAAEEMYELASLDELLRKANYVSAILDKCSLS